MEAILFSPLNLRGITLRNRIVVSPMLQYSATGGHVNDWHLMHYGKFAAGGAGLVFVESTKVDPRGCSTPRDLGLWKDDYIDPLRRITDLIKRNGALAAMVFANRINDMSFIATSCIEEVAYSVRRASGNVQISPDCL